MAAAEEEAETRHVPIAELIAHNLYSFVNGKPLKNTPTPPVDILLSRLDTKYTAESLRELAPNLDQLSASEILHIVTLARGRKHTMVLDGGWVSRRANEIIRRRPNSEA